MKTNMEITLNSMQMVLEQILNRLNVIEYDIRELRGEITSGFKQTDKRIDKLYEHVDGFVSVFDRHECEIVALRHCYEVHEELLENFK